jgi:hypothetical protein
MYIRLSREIRDEYPKDLHQFPEAEKVLNLVQKYLDIQKVDFHVGEQPQKEFTMTCHIQHTSMSFPEVEAINIQYRNYPATGHVSYTMCFEFQKHSFFNGIYDSESYGKDAETVLLSLFNGHLEWMKSFAKDVVKQAQDLSSKVPAKKRTVKDGFHSREYT